MSVRFLALLAVAALAFAPSSASAGLFGRGCCGSEPSYGGCDAAPSCGCEIADPSCGCEVAPSCDPCARTGLFGKLKGMKRGFGSCFNAPGCCESAPSCGCEIAAPSCGYEIAAPSCCDASAPRCKIFGGLKSRFSGHHGCGAASGCGCDAAPSFGGYAAPSCGCGM